MRKNILIIILVLILIAVIFFLDWPAYQRVVFLRDEIKMNQEFLKEKQELGVKVGQLKQSYESREDEIKMALVHKGWMGMGMG